MKNLKEFFHYISTDEKGEKFSYVCNKHLEVLPHKSFRVKESLNEEQCKIKGCENTSHHLIYFN